MDMAIQSANDVRFATSIGGSLAVHLLLMAALQTLGPLTGRVADVAQPAPLIVSLPGAAPAPLSVQAEAAPAALPTTPLPDAARDRPVDGAGSQSAPDLSLPIPLPVPEPPFFTLAELDKPPVAIRDIETDPPELRQYTQGGKLVVQLWIDETGKVVKTEVVNSDLPEAFAASARENFMRIVFRPAKKNGAAVRARVSAMIVYEPRS